MINETRYPKRYLIAVLLSVSLLIALAWHSVPVVHSTEISNIRYVTQGVKFDVRFYKSKPCRFDGMSWYDKNNERYPIVWPEKEKDLPASRPTGWQTSRNWMLLGGVDIKNSYAWVHHHCLGVSKNSRFYN